MAEAAKTRHAIKYPNPRIAQEAEPTIQLSRYPTMKGGAAATRWRTRPESLSAAPGSTIHRAAVTTPANTSAHAILVQAFNCPTGKPLSSNRGERSNEST